MTKVLKLVYVMIVFLYIFLVVADTGRKPFIILLVFFPLRTFINIQ